MDMIELFEGMKVKLNQNAYKWKFGNSTMPQFKVDNLTIGEIYTVAYTTPLMPVSGGKQQFVSILYKDGTEVMGTYPSNCFDLI